MHVLSKEKFKVLAEQQGWSLTTAEGYVDGEAFRKRGKKPPAHALVGMDEYSEGFRAGYYARKPRGGKGKPSKPSAPAKAPSGNEEITS
jgi:hypothetical protein